MNLFRRTLPPQVPIRLPSNIITIPVDESWTLEQFGRLLDRAPGWQLKFFAADHPSLTDPGGYVLVVRNETDDPACTTYLREVANHGWNSNHVRTERAEIVSELYRNRTEQGAGVRVRLEPYRVPDNVR